MTTTEQYILNYAYGHGTIVSADILKSAEANGISSTALNWHLRRLVSEKKLFRTGRGQYSVTGRQPFKESPDEELVRRHTELISQYPTVRCCLYKGTIIAPLLHHLSYNALTYIEVDKELTEILFHRLRDSGEAVYLKPSQEVMQNYVDIGKPGIIIKPLITGAPTTTENGVPMSTLEKLLVDTLCDEDFSYLQGGEWYYMIEMAADNYNINKSRLLRYAGRRGKKEIIANKLKEFGL